MKRRLLCIALLFLTTGCPKTPVTGRVPGLPPTTQRSDRVEKIHGVLVADPYRWLEDGSKPEVEQWAEHQNAYTRGQLDAQPGRAAIRKRLQELAQVDFLSAPSRRGGRIFYARRGKDQEKWVRYWKEGEDGTEQVLLDANKLSKDGSVSVGWASVSRDGKWVAYQRKENNADEAVLHLREVKTGREVDAERIEGVNYTYPSWLPDGSGFYYSQLPPVGQVDDTERTGHSNIKFHKLGTDPADDKVIFGVTGDPEMLQGVHVSWDGRWVFVGRSKGFVDDIWFKDRTKPESEFEVLIDGDSASYSVTAWKDRFYIRTNEDAPRFRLFVATPDKPRRADWQEVLPQRKMATFSDFQIVGDRLIVRYLVDATDQIGVYDFQGNKLRDVELPGLGSASGLVGTPDDARAFYYYSSFTTPTQIFETDVTTGATKEWARVNVPVDPTRYVVEQIRFPSRDGTVVTMFLVHMKGIKLDKSHRVLLTGYGGFTVTLKSSFNRWIHPWLESGGIYAMANLRGGGEYGEDWHRAGMLGNKQNVFDDFIAAADYLVEQGYTTPGKLAIEGGSNGGLLMGAVTAQRPRMFRAVLCSAPLMDMIRYHKFGVGKVWVPEYGNPEDPEHFQYLYAYSPYHHLEKGADYPAFLMMSPKHDDRVDPMHARKFIAQLQWAQAGDAPILLRVEEAAGHSGGDMISKTVELYTDIYSFLNANLGGD